MTTRTIQITDRVYDYMQEVSVREPEILKRLRAETAELPEHNMQISPEQGQFMALLVGLIGARRALEIGTFTGYSALAVALALPDDGKLIACEISEEYTAIGRRYWQEAGLDTNIDLKIGLALDTLDGLITEGQAETYDFAFIDADKVNYQNYFDRALILLRPGGLIAVDNVLWNGAVADPRNTTKDTEAIREFNAELGDDTRVAISMVPIGDGLTLARKL
ncbi:MAG: class I SAM-dependent methyltransferase [Rhodospirillales bacterium]